MTKTSGRKWNKGFSLGEMMAVVAIISILAAFAFVSVISFQRRLTLMNYDNMAEEIFIATQYRMTSMTSSNKVDLSDEEQFGRAVGNGSYIAYYNGSSYSGEFLESLLPKNSIDETVRVNGNYIILYNPGQAIIQDVFYSDVSDSRFGYEFSDADIATFGFSDLLVSLMSTEEDDKKALRRSVGEDKKIIGYYGGAEIEEEDPDRLKTPTILVTNGDILKVNISDPNSTGIIPAEGIILTLTVRGEKSGNVRVFSAEELSASIVRTTASNDVLEYEFTLDDVTRSGQRFLELCPTLYGGEDVTVFATVTKDGQSVTSEKKVVNSFYQSYTENRGEDGNVATVSSFRHFINLNHRRSDMKSDSLTKLYVALGEQSVDLDWDSFLENVNKSSYSYPNYEVHTDFSYDGLNHKISNLVIDREGNAGLYTRTEAKLYVSNLELANFDITSTKENAGALIGKVSHSDGNQDGRLYATNILVSNTDDAREIRAAKSAGGLVGSFEYAGNNLEKDKSISEINNCAASTYVVAGDCAGGLVGYIEYTDIDIINSYVGGHLTDRGIYSSATTAGLKGRANVISTGASGSAGGFIGGAKQESSQYVYDFNIQNCYSTASSKVTSQGANVAKFVGSINRINGTYRKKDHYYDFDKIYGIGVAYTSSDAKNTALVNETGSGKSTLEVKNVSFSKTTTARNSANPYLTSLGTTYPFKSIVDLAELDTSSGDVPNFLYAHVGDWNYELENHSMVVNNGDKLAVTFVVSDSEDFDLFITGEQSGVQRRITYYAGDGKQYDVRFPTSDGMYMYSGYSSYYQWGNRYYIASRTSSKAYNYYEVSETEDGTAHQYTVYLDDITSPGGHFYDLFGTEGFITGENLTITLRVGEREASIWEVLPSPEDPISTNGWNRYPDITVNTVNSLFESYSYDWATSEGTAQIANVRHLQNLDQDVSSYAYPVQNVVQVADIDWASFVANVGLIQLREFGTNINMNNGIDTNSWAYINHVTIYSTTGANRYGGMHQLTNLRMNASLAYNQDFFGINTSTIKSYTATRTDTGASNPTGATAYVLQNFIIESRGTDASKAYGLGDQSAGIFRNVTTNEITFKDVYLKNNYVNAHPSGPGEAVAELGTNAGVLVGYASGAVNLTGKITVEDMNVFGDLGVGALIGAIGQEDTTLDGSAGSLNLNDGELQVLGEIKVASISPSAAHREREAVGGVVGYLNGNLNFNGSSNISVIARGTENVIRDPYQFSGGIAGDITGAVFMAQVTNEPLRIWVTTAEGSRLTIDAFAEDITDVVYEPGVFGLIENQANAEYEYRRFLVNGGVVINRPSPQPMSISDTSDENTESDGDDMSDSKEDTEDKTEDESKDPTDTSDDTSKTEDGTDETTPTTDGDDAGTTTPTDSSGSTGSDTTPATGTDTGSATDGGTTTPTDPVTAGGTIGEDGTLNSGSDSSGDNSSQAEGGEG